jgi:hypothetical protein
MTSAFEETLNARYAECHPTDSERIIQILGPFFANADRYYPVFCFYVAALYRARRLDEAAKAALFLHEKAVHDPDTVEQGWKVPPMPMELYRKARSAHSRDLAFAGDRAAAIAVLEELVARGIASETDARRLERYRLGE